MNRERFETPGERLIKNVYRQLVDGEVWRLRPPKPLILVPEVLLQEFVLGRGDCLHGGHAGHRLEPGNEGQETINK